MNTQENVLAEASHDAGLRREIEQVNALKLGVAFRRANSPEVVSESDRLGSDVVRSVLSFEDMAWEISDYIVPASVTSRSVELA